MPLSQKRDNHKYTIRDIYNLPEGTRAELIDGQIYYMAPPNRIHQKILSYLHTDISNYIRSKSGPCEIYPAPFGVYLDGNNDKYLEPDITIICDPGKLDDKGCKGAPDWIIEIVSPSTASKDYTEKLTLYKTAGVCEYWIVNPQKKSTFVYFFEETAFDVQYFTFQDKIKVNIYDDLVIDLSKLNI